MTEPNKINSIISNADILHDLKPVMSIDQAFDGTGVAFTFPSYCSDNSIEEFIRTVLPIFDDRFQTYTREMVQSFTSALTTGKSTLFVTPESKRAKPYSFGQIFTSAQSPSQRSVVLHGIISFSPSNIPEWRQAKMIANILLDLASKYQKVIQLQSKGQHQIFVTFEGLASHGNKSSISILPCLGILYGSIWEIFSSSETLSANLFELPITTWKKVFSGNGKIDKKGVKNLLYTLGFSRIGSDDESDAIAMALVASTNPEACKASYGRIRPTLEAGEKKREERKLKEERKKAREEQRLIKLELKKTEKKKTKRTKLRA